MQNDEVLKHMSYDSLDFLRKHQPTWKLIAMRNSALVISFLYKEFIYVKRREIPEYELAGSLDLFMEDITEFDDTKKSSIEYLKEWTSEEYGFLRSFFPLGNDEVHYDLTSSAQKAIEWILDLKQSNFIGTESRLLLIFDLLNQVVEQSEENPELRIAELERQKAEIETEIEQTKKGNIKLLDSTQVRERFFQALTMSNEILSDFRAVEQKFRELSRDMREKIATWEGGKGDLIGSYFTEQNDIYNSDQGKSFQAFFEFLMSHSSQVEFESIIERLRMLDILKADVEKSGIDLVVDDWLEGSQYVWGTVQSMSEQLRRYVDENFLEEERRIDQLVKSIEKNAIIIGDNQPSGWFLEMNDSSPSLNLVFDRILYKPTVKIGLINDVIEYGSNSLDEDFSYDYIYIDKEQLKSNINSLLVSSDQISFLEIVEKFPIKYGLTEILEYLTLNNFGLDYYVNEEFKDEIVWYDSAGNKQTVTFSRIEFFNSKE